MEVEKKEESPAVELTERETVYKAFAEAQSVEAATVASPAEEVEKETPNSEVEGENASSVKTVASPGEEDADITREKPRSEEKKMVPYDALHEERERRKALQYEVEALKRQFDQSLNASKAATSETVEGFDTEGNVTDYDVAMKSLVKSNLELRRELNSVKGKSDLIESDFRSKREREATDLLKTRITTTNDVLAAEGFPGFSEFTPMVTAELNRMLAEDAGNRAYDNEEGWRRIYREKIFPKVAASAGEHVRQDGFEQKKVLKAAANLSKAPGGLPPKTVKEEEWSKESYLKMRQRYNTEEL